MHHKPFSDRTLPGSSGGAYSAPRPPSWIKGFASETGGNGRDDVERNGEEDGGRRKAGREKVEERMQERKVRQRRWERKRVGEGKVGKDCAVLVLDPRYHHRDRHP